MTPLDLWAGMRMSPKFCLMPDLDQRKIIRGIITLSEEGFLTGEIPDERTYALLGHIPGVTTPVSNMQGLVPNRRRALWFNKEGVLRIRETLHQKKLAVEAAVVEVARIP
jgi:hypothetical protein